MGFLDDVKKGANQLSSSINASVQDTKTNARVNNLLHDLGALTWATRTGQAPADAAAEQARIEGELADLVASGATVDLGLKTAAPPPPPPPPPPPAG